MCAHAHRAASLGQGALLLAMLALAGCGSAPQKTAPSSPVRPSPPAPAGTPSRPEPGVPALPPAGSGRGGYYQDDGPGDNPPPNLDTVPDAEVRNDPLLPRSNRPYVVFGKTYTPITDNKPYSEIGVGSWYGKKFHGQRTSSGEIYDMYKMTAAHPTLPIPSYARLTNLISGAQVIVRINDRGPFHPNRAIDVSYTAALKLGLLSKGSHELKIDRILPDEVNSILAERASAPVRTQLPSMQATASSQVQPLVLAPKAVPRTGLNAMPLYASITPAPVVASAAPAAEPAVPVAPSRPADIEALMLADRAPSDAVGAETLVPVSAQPAPAQASAETAPVKSGYYLQLGAYSRAENAEAVRAKVAQAANNFSTLEVVQAGPVLRLFGGPFASRQEAAQAAQGLPSSLGLKPIIIQR